ncbi:MAG: rod-binding protein [Methylocystis sp.]|uniref:rod-binding protein n=1 Tax=Methylocystis sp. TaxID=1911079 RepID=UPI003DA3820D
MSIFPATDIVSDVARAADPGKVRVAIQRLEALSGDKVGEPAGTFALARAALAPMRPQAPAIMSDSAAPTGARMTPIEPTQKFEAFLLQSWLEVLLPKQESGVFGAGPGADIWRSMMAEHLATDVVRAGGVGLQKLLDHKNSSVSVQRS